MSSPARTTSSSRSGTFVAQLSAPLRRFVRTEAGSAGLLALATLVALVWANSPWGDSYDRVWRTEFSVQLGSAGITEDLPPLGQRRPDSAIAVFYSGDIDLVARAVAHCACSAFRWCWRPTAGCWSSRRPRSCCPSPAPRAGT